MKIGHSLEVWRFLPLEITHLGPLEVAACVPCQRRALAHVRANAAINHHKASRWGFGVWGERVK